MADIYNVGDYTHVLDSTSDGGSSITNQEYYQVSLQQNDKIIENQQKIIDGNSDLKSSIETGNGYLSTLQSGSQVVSGNYDTSLKGISDNGEFISILLCLVIGVIIGYIAIKGVLDNWRAR